MAHLYYLCILLGEKLTMTTHFKARESELVVADDVQICRQRSLISGRNRRHDSNNNHFRGNFIGFRSNSTIPLHLSGYLYSFQVWDWKKYSLGYFCQMVNWLSGLKSKYLLRYWPLAFYKLCQGYLTTLKQFWAVLICATDLSHKYLHTICRSWKVTIRTK
jgi:hypothetical protein